MNTLFTYQYRDAHNYKRFEEVVVAGRLSIEELNPFLHEGEFFLPELVGLESLSPTEHSEVDHDWHEIVSLEATEAADSGLPSWQLVSRFEFAHAKGWPLDSLLQRRERRLWFG